MLNLLAYLQGASAFSLQKYILDGYFQVKNNHTVRYIKQNGIDSNTDVSHTLLLGFALESVFLCGCVFFKYTKLTHKHMHFYEA